LSGIVDGSAGLSRQALQANVELACPAATVYGGRAQARKPDSLAMQIIVRDNNIDQALRALKKKLQREGVYREMKLRRHYEKPSEKRAREHAAAISRARKAERKRLERDS
jgi:small subunit ribosomal protein S21